VTSPEKLLLLVEDSEDDVLLFMHVYRKSGISNPVQVVGDGAEAIDYLFGNGKYADRSCFPFPGLVLLDLRLPRIPGLEVLKRVRAEPALAALPVVILSSSNQDVDMKEAKALGANHYKVKPSNPHDLQEYLLNLKREWLT